MDERDATALREYLAERDAACPACGYSLRGLRSEACPECNQVLTLRVGLLEPTGGAYIATVVGLAIGAGAALLMVIAVVVISRWQGFPRGKEAFYLITYPTTMALALGAPFGVLATRRGRRWFGTRRLGERRSLAGIAWSSAVGGFAIWLFLVVTRL